MSKHRRPELFPEDVTEDQILEAAGAISTLVVQPGWKIWESLVGESRDASLENLATSTPDKVLYWQGYAAALRHVIQAPEVLLQEAKGVQDEIQERTGEIDDRVRVTRSYSPSDPSV